MDDDDDVDFGMKKLNLIFKEKKEAKKRKHAVVSVFCVLIEI